MLPTVNGEFRLVADPELVFGTSGTPVCRFRLVANSRKKDENGEWQNDKVCWLRGVAFNTLANHVAGTFKKGDLALVTGRLQTESYERDDGSKGESFTVVADTMGPSLAFVEAKMNKQTEPSNKSTESPWAEAPGDEPPF